MAQSKETRALQHLLLQGFTLYTSEAADALRARGPSSLDDPAHAYAVVLGSGMVQCCWGGAQLLVPLATDDVRDARLKLGTAGTVRVAPRPLEGRRGVQRFVVAVARAAPPAPPVPAPHDVRHRRQHGPRDGGPPPPAG